MTTKVIIGAEITAGKQVVVEISHFDGEQFREYERLSEGEFRGLYVSTGQIIRIREIEPE